MVADKLAEGTDAVAEVGVAATAEGGGDATAEGEADAAADAVAELVPDVATAEGEADAATDAVAELVPDAAAETADNAVATAERVTDVASSRMADCGVEGDTWAAAARTGEESRFGLTSTIARGGGTNWSSSSPKPVYAVAIFR